MTANYTLVDALLQQAVPEICPSAQLVVRQRGQTVAANAYGWLDPETRETEISMRTRFGLASVTKLFVVTAFMTLVKADKVAVDQPVGSVLPAFNGVRPIQPYEDPLAWGEFVTIDGLTEPVDSGAITFRQLLTHSSGLPAWRPLFREPDVDAAQGMALNTFFSYQPDTHVVYSDIGLILLGMAVERLTDQRLDRAVNKLVIEPLGLEQTGYLTIQDGVPAIDIAPTEFCTWRNRRIIGQVHDENAYRLDGVAGHAGIFSTADDVARFGQMYLDGGGPLLSQETVAEMTRLQTKEGDVRRGLGFVLWTPVPDADADGRSFSEGTFGHTGFTGTSLWIDPERELVVVLLTNEVYHGRTDRKIAQLRSDVHSTLLAAIDAASTEIPK
jgi:CubicO group peptidase (beta-lactamase class C family)